MNKPRAKERGQGVKPSKTAYIHMRVTPEVKVLLKTRANINGVSLTDYLINCGLQEVS
jgi:uncharacterized protein (DUF1778 family)